jgi:5-methylcytosine-specific restriction endonuclease McrA
MKKYTNEQKELAISLRKQGFTHEDICSKTGIKNSTTIHNLCVAAGLKKGFYPRKIKYEVGQRYFQFVITGEAPHKKSKTGRIYTQWECKCDCGITFITTTKQIQKGVRKSCGCLTQEARFKRKDEKEVVGNLCLGHYKCGAKRRNLEWALSSIDFMKLLFSSCIYCGSPPSRLVKVSVHQQMVNGIDRVDSSVGYILDNCVPCCMFCNRAKNDSTQKEFLEWIERLKKYENSGNK